MKIDNQQPSRLLTEEDLKVGNRFECIESFHEGIINFLKGETYKCDDNRSIWTGKHNYYFHSAIPLNRHFKLSHQPQEEVKQDNMENIHKIIIETAEGYYGASVAIIKIEDEITKYTNKKLYQLQQENERLKELLVEIYGHKYKDEITFSDKAYHLVAQIAQSIK